MSDTIEGKGVVKFFNDPKGYGFILLDDEQTEVFVHQTKIKMEGHRTLHEKQPVDLTYYKEEKGFKAECVTPDLEWAKENVRNTGGGRRDDDRYRGGYDDNRRGGYDRGYGGSGGGGYSSRYDYDRRDGYDRGGYGGGSYDRGYGSSSSGGGGYSSGGYGGSGYGGDYGHGGGSYGRY